MPRIAFEQNEVGASSKKSENYPVTHSEIYIAESSSGNNISEGKKSGPGWRPALSESLARECDLRVRGCVTGTGSCSAAPTQVGHWHHTPPALHARLFRLLLVECPESGRGRPRRRRRGGRTRAAPGQSGPTPSRPRGSWWSEKSSNSSIPRSAADERMGIPVVDDASYKGARHGHGGPRAKQRFQLPQKPPNDLLVRDKHLCAGKRPCCVANGHKAARSRGRGGLERDLA